MKILILRATGSIGLQTIEGIQKFQEIELFGFSFVKNIEKGKHILKIFTNVCVFSKYVQTLNSCDSYDELINKTKPDIVLNSVIGFAGLDLSILCLNKKINLILANKESMVVAGKFLIELANKIIFL